MDSNGLENGAFGGEGRPEAPKNLTVFVRFVTFVLSLIRRPQGVSRDCGVGRAGCICFHSWSSQITRSQAK